MLSASCRLVCILVYDQRCFDDDALSSSSNNNECEVTISWGNTILNHALIIANTFAVIVVSQTSLHKSRQHAHQQHNDTTAAIPTGVASCICLAFTVAFQFCLCLFVVDCVGVSIIWCATFGWLLMCTRTAATKQTKAILKNNTHTQSATVRAVTFLDCGTILFYAVAFDAITTIAHILAILVGVLLWKVSFFWSNNKIRQT